MNKTEIIMIVVIPIAFFWQLRLGKKDADGILTWLYKGKKQKKEI